MADASSSKISRRTFLQWAGAAAAMPALDSPLTKLLPSDLPAIEAGTGLAAIETQSIIGTLAKFVTLPVRLRFDELILHLEGNKPTIFMQHLNAMKKTNVDALAYLEQWQTDVSKLKNISLSAADREQLIAHLEEISSRVYFNGLHRFTGSRSLPEEVNKIVEMSNVPGKLEQLIAETVQQSKARISVMEEATERLMKTHELKTNKPTRENKTDQPEPEATPDDLAKATREMGGIWCNRVLRMPASAEAKKR